jgi:uncharacterized peroxidase-related enzyme
MSRLTPIAFETATGPNREMFDAIKSKLGVVPNLMRTFAQSPATLKFFLAASEALSGSTLSAKIREQIDLVVSQENGCDYCLAAHTLLAKNHRLTDTQIENARAGGSDDVLTDAVLNLAKTIVTQRGHLTDDDFAAARAAGVSDAQVSDVFAAVSLKIFTNYFAIANEIELDFPPAPALKPVAV